MVEGDTVQEDKEVFVDIEEHQELQRRAEELEAQLARYTAQPRCLTTVKEMRDGETVRRQNKEYPVVGGRLRAFREDWGRGGALRTENVSQENTGLTVFRCEVYGDGKLLATGTGTCPERDFQGRETRIEMAETRAVGRALRLAGYGVDGTSAEEMSGPDMQESGESEPPTAEQRKTIREILKEAEKHGVKLGEDLVPPGTDEEAEALIKRMRTALQEGMAGKKSATNGSKASQKPSGKPQRGQPNRVK